MTANDIILRARSVSDLPASQFVSHLDELNSLNEAWKDVYSALVENDDDYYVTETTITLSAIYAVAGTANEYLYPLPADFLKIRYLDFRGDANNYMPVKKFSLAQKDDQPGDPYYRIKGTNLWIIGGSVPSAGMTLRMGYYAAVATITCPQNDLLYGTSYTGAQYSTISSPAYAPLGQTFIYANSSTFVIYAESLTNSTVATPTALFTESAAVTNIYYYQGQLYYIRGTDIWYKPTQLAAAFTAPTQVGAITGVVCFCIYGGIIYYANATQIRHCTFAGGSDTLVSATAGITSIAVAQGVVFAGNGATVVSIAPATTMYAAGIAAVSSDGTNLYILDSAANVRQVTFTAATAAILLDQTVDTMVTSMGIPVVDPGQTPQTTIVPTIHSVALPTSSGLWSQLIGSDGSVNFNFSYPNNLVPEIMAWRSAIDYRTKQGADISAYLLRLGHPTIDGEPSLGLWARFEQMIKRDEYTVSRIRNHYQDRSWPR